ncbi:MAG: GNAT family N-acetyltransferase, partial [Candidatus Hydrogenedentes bacterium]|nr:GNAT family N-acetyltransferase [Candidatus Hydrogenedentota bacterium]
MPPTNLTLHTYAHARDFLARMRPLLEAQEAVYGLMLGVAQNVADDPQRYGKYAPYFAVVEDKVEDGVEDEVEDGDGVAAAAVMTPPYGIILYSERPDPQPGLDAIAHDLAEHSWLVFGVNARVPLGAKFADTWTRLTNTRAVPAVEERVFVLSEVVHPPYSPGRMRLATPDDLELATQWQMDFVAEALAGVEPVDPEKTRRNVERRIAAQTFYLWDDGGPVSLAGTARPTLHGIAIGPVYTPSHLRGRGYASSLVAALSQRMLEQGRDFVTLFTNLANPTSNHIYQAIG